MALVRRASSVSVAAIKETYGRHVIPAYARYDLALTHGKGSYAWDVTGKRYLDFGGGVAVNCLGHAHPEVVETLAEQGARMLHSSNLYYVKQQADLAESLCGRLPVPGKMFFCNSGAEANEGLFKLARIVGHDKGRYEIITAVNSFHGRTLAGIAATGQDKVKKGFEPAMPGFKHVPFNDLEAARAAVGPKTAAILIEGVQGEGGVIPASAAYLRGLRKLCNDQGLLLMTDGVQCGHYRTGRFHSFQRILEDVDTAWAPDALSMAKSLGAGFPIGGFWARSQYADKLSPGTHGNTFGGNPLGSSVSLKVLEVIDRDKLADNARARGNQIMGGLKSLQAAYPGIIANVRGLGLMIAIELTRTIPQYKGSSRTPAADTIDRLHKQGVLVVPSGEVSLRVLPPLNITTSEVDEFLQHFEAVVKTIT